MSEYPDGHPGFGKWAGEKPTATQKKLLHGGALIKREPNKRWVPKGSAKQPGPAQMTVKHDPTPARLAEK